MIATTRAALLRGTTTQDALGDDVDDNSTPFRLYSDWAETRRNRVPNPGNGVVNPFLTPARATQAPGAGFNRFTVNDALLADMAQRATTRAYTNPDSILVSPLTSYVFSGEARCSVVGQSMRAYVQFGDSGGTLLGAQIQLPTIVSDPVAFGTIAAVITTPANAARAMINIGLAGVAAGRAIGSTFDVRNLFVEESSTIDSTFDGDTPATELARYSWTATPEASPSIQETRTITTDYSDFPASIIETSRREYDEASNTWRSVRYYSGRVSSNVPAKAGDRIRDNRDGSIYTVEEVERVPRGLSGRASVTLTMRRTAP